MTITWRKGETPSLERPVIGRRSSEAQMDCVNLIIPGKIELPLYMDSQNLLLDQGTQLPMPAELLEGVRIFLQEEVALADKRRFGFLAKVAANSLGIAQRELIHGPVLAEAENARLEALNFKGSLDRKRWLLIDDIRRGLDLDTVDLADHLRQTVAAQLKIDQPHYSALFKDS